MQVIATIGKYTFEKFTSKEKLKFASLEATPVHDEYYLFLLKLKAVILNLVYFILDKHFQVNRPLIKYSSTQVH